MWAGDFANEFTLSSVRGEKSDRARTFPFSKFPREEDNPGGRANLACTRFRETGMKTTFARGLAFVALVAAATPVLAASMEPRFGNTMQATRPDGTVLKLYYNRDHTFSGEIVQPGAPAPFEAKGTWRLDGDRLCVMAEGPAGKPGRESCAVLKGDKVGDKWQSTVQGTDGKPVTQSVEIVKGR